MNVVLQRTITNEALLESLSIGAQEVWKSLYSFESFRHRLTDIINGVAYQPRSLKANNVPQVYKSEYEHLNKSI